MPSQLFSPLHLRQTTLANRIVVSPMCQYSATDGVPGDWHLMHLGSFAVSGPGLVFTEATAVEAIGRITPGCTSLYNDQQQEAWARIVKFMHEHGTAKVGLQLAHAGRKASTAAPWLGGKPLAGDGGAWDAIGPSPTPFADGWPVPVAMDAKAMDRVKGTFVETAGRALEIGFDLIELHAAHAYLMSSFLSPLSNQRTDDYGGSRENRMRFPLEVFEAVRAVWPEEKPLGMRISASDWQDDGWTIEDSVALTKQLKARGCDFIDCSSGGNTADRPPVGPGKPGYQVPLAAQIKREAEIPTIAVGMIRDPELAESIVAEGKTDLVALARGMLYDPRWSWHAAETLGAEADYPPQYARSRPETWPRAFPERTADAAE